MASPQQAAAALRAFEKALPVAILRGLRRGLLFAERLVKTKYMTRGDNRHPKVWDPPNPPPGPLKIRSGNLGRSVKQLPMRFTGREIIGGLQAGDNQVRYARIHELGGHAGRASIPARPYLAPAIAEARKMIEAEVIKEMRAAARATLAGIAKVA